MEVTKQREQAAETQEIIEQYRSILHTMTSELIQGWRTRYRRPKNQTEDSNLTNLTRFLKEFDDFSWAYFEYVIDKMPDEVKGNPRQVRRDLRRVINNLQRNWGELIAICNQRENRKLRTVLKQADTEAQSFYARFGGHKPSLELLDDMTAGEPVMPLTYFGTRYEITRYAYTPFPLLSFRYEALGEPTLRRNSLAHELGHFIYWNATPAAKAHQLVAVHQNLDKEVDKVVRNNRPPTLEAAPGNQDDAFAQKLTFHWRNWKPEVFADIVGTILAGPSYVVTSLRLHVDEQPTDQGALHPDDTYHPHPILRPLIGLETLELLSQEGGMYEPLGNEIKKLREQWEITYRQAIESSKDVTIDEKQAPRVLEVAALVEQTPEIVRTLLEEELWINAKGEPSTLKNLFEGEGENGKQGAPNTGRRRKRESKSLAALVKALEIDIKNSQIVNTKVVTKPMDEKMRQYRALIDLPLAESRGYRGCLNVIDVGDNKGNYDVAGGSCLSGMDVIEVGWGNGRFAL